MSAFEDYSKNWLKANTTKKMGVLTITCLWLPKIGDPFTFLVHLGNIFPFLSYVKNLKFNFP
jgi:membrane protein YqaA with SNARE-associated domain